MTKYLVRRENLIIIRIFFNKYKKFVNSRSLFLNTIMVLAKTTAIAISIYHCHIILL